MLQGTMADCMSQRMSKANALFSEDSDSISFYSATQTRIQILVITDNINRTTYKPLQEIFGIHKHEGIGSLRLDKNIDITTLMVFATGHRSEKPERLDAIVVLKCTTTALQNVYVICLAHTPS